VHCGRLVCATVSDGFTNVRTRWICTPRECEHLNTRSFTLNYGSGSRHTLNCSVASCFCVASNRCDCGNSRSSRFCKGASSSRFGSRRPDDSISVRPWGAHNPTIWFMGTEPVKSWNSFKACFYGRVSSIQKKLFTPIVFLWAIEF